MVPVRMRFRRLLRCAAASPDRRARAFGRDLLRLWPALWTFLRIKGVEPTNNRAEQALRSPVIRRKLCFGSQSGSGLRATERLLSVTRTCRQHQRNLLGYLTEAITAHRQGYTPPALLPAN
jgi:transposase